MLAFLVSRTAVADRAVAPVGAPSGAVMEALEGRRLLSGSPYTLAQIGFFGANDTGAGPSTLTADAAGNWFGTTSGGGAYGAGTVFEIPAGTSTITALASFDGADGANPGAGVTLDPAGDLYGTTEYGGANNYGTVFEIAKGSTTITTLASFNGANLILPEGRVGLDSAGNLFGTTYGGGGSDGTVF